MSGPGPRLVSPAGDPVASQSAPAATGPNAPAPTPEDEFIRELTLTIRYNMETKRFTMAVDPPEIIQHRDILYSVLGLARERVTMVAVREFLTATQKRTVITPDDYFRTGGGRPR